jgi:RHS repeat-associated protein
VQTDQRTYTYDLTGNPTDRSAVVGSNNRLTSYDGWTLTYDLEGNLTGKSKTGQPTYGFTWTAWGKLATVTVNGSTAATYAYDGLGRRVARTAGGSTQHFIYQEEDLLLSLSSSGAVVDEYTYLPGIDQPLGLRRSGTQYYYHTDANGNVLALTNVAGTVVNQYSYTPFGVAESVLEGVSNALRFASREWDADAGLYYNRARWYDPQLQRFISQDPIGIDGGMNLYTYANNDPVNGFDPTGLMRASGCGVVGPFSWEMGPGHEVFGDPVNLCTNPIANYIVMEARAAAARQCEWWRCPTSPIPAPNLEGATALVNRVKDYVQEHPCQVALAGLAWTATTDALFFTGVGAAAKLSAEGGTIAAAGVSKGLRRMTETGVTMMVQGHTQLVTKVATTGAMRSAAYPVMHDWHGVGNFLLDITPGIATIRAGIRAYRACSN